MNAVGRKTADFHDQDPRSESPDLGVGTMGASCACLTCRLHCGVQRAEGSKGAGDECRRLWWAVRELEMGAACCSGRWGCGRRVPPAMVGSGVLETGAASCSGQRAGDECCKLQCRMLLPYTPHCRAPLRRGAATRKKWREEAAKGRRGNGAEKEMEYHVEDLPRGIRRYSQNESC